MGTHNYPTKKLDGVQKEPPTCIKKAMSALKRQESKQTKRQEPHKANNSTTLKNKKLVMQTMQTYHIIPSRIAHLGEKMKILIEIHK